MASREKLTEVVEEVTEATWASVGAPGHLCPGLPGGGEVELEVGAVLLLELRARGHHLRS